jgi:hypothetical protein
MIPPCFADSAELPERAQHQEVYCLDDTARSLQATMIYSIDSLANNREYPSWHF